MHDLEVNEQSNLLAAEFEVMEQLCFENRCHYFNRFQFDHDLVLDQQIKPIADIIELNSIVDEGKPNFDSHVQPALSEFINQASLIRVLKKPGSKRRMHLHRGVD